ncbi:MAG: hypothetical protein WAM11_02870 [Cyanobium sp.]
MKSLLTLNLAAMAPSPSIAVKKSLSLLRAIGLSAGLVASTASMPAVHAATSATITATGIIASACSVSGATIPLVFGIRDPGSPFPNWLRGSSGNVPYSTASFTRFTVSAPTVTGPNASSTVTNIDIREGGELLEFAANNNNDKKDASFSKTGINSGSFEYIVTLFGGTSSSPQALAPGTYSVSSTITCIQ